MSKNAKAVPGKAAGLPKNPKDKTPQEPKTPKQQTLLQMEAILDNAAVVQEQTQKEIEELKKEKKELADGKQEVTEGLHAAEAEIHRLTALQRAAPHLAHPWAV